MMNDEKAQLMLAQPNPIGLVIFSVWAGLSLL